MLPSTIVTAFVLCITSLFNGVNAQNDPNPEVEDPALINEIVLAKVNYYRAVSGVNTVTWNADDLGVSGVEAMNCSVTNDVSTLCSFTILQLADLHSTGILEVE